MHIRLRMHTSLPVAYIIGFDKTQHGNKGEVEQDGRIHRKDALIAINYIPLYNMTFDEMLAVIRSQPEASRDHPRILTFTTINYFASFSLLENDPVKNLLETLHHDLQSIRMPYTVRLQVIKRCIDDKSVIDESLLRSLAAMGFPDGCGGLRSTAWKVLLGYLPYDSAAWEDHLHTQRQLYTTLLSEVSVRPSHDTDDTTGSINKVTDHPLHDDEDRSLWAKFWSDALLLDSIQKDVIRTYPDLKFFLDSEGRHQEAMQNILFLYAKLNPGIKYVQGMNELVGTLYYVFANDQNDDSWVSSVEADTFFCFSLLMSEIRDMYIHNMDNTSTGISGRIQRFIDILRTYDPVVCDLLIDQGIDPSFYSLRWITTLLSREFDLLDTIRLWDSLLGDRNREEFLAYICCAMVLEQRESLMTGDFGENLSLLQSYPPIDVTYLLQKSASLREHHKSGFAVEQEESHLNNASPVPVSSSQLISEVWRASSTLSRMVVTASNEVRSTLFRSTDGFGNVRSFTSFDDDETYDRSAFEGGHLNTAVLNEKLISLWQQRDIKDQRDVKDQCESTIICLEAYDGIKSSGGENSTCSDDEYNVYGTSY